MNNFQLRLWRANKEAGEQIDKNAHRSLQILSFEQRQLLERRYAQDPVGVHAELVQEGYRLMPNQLKIDLEMGRLDEYRRADRSPR